MWDRVEAGFGRDNGEETDATAAGMIIVFYFNKNISLSKGMFD